MDDGSPDEPVAASPLVNPLPRGVRRPSKHQGQAKPFALVKAAGIVALVSGAALTWAIIADRSGMPAPPAKMASAVLVTELSTPAVTENADESWQAVKDIQGELIGEGGNYRAYNARLTAAYHKWEQLEAQQFGPDWKTLWRERHAGDVLGECESLKNLGMTRSECVSMEQSQGDIEPLQPMLMKCSPGGEIMPRDPISCRTHGRESEDSVRRAAQTHDEPVTSPG